MKNVEFLIEGMMLIFRFSCKILAFCGDFILNFRYNELKNLANVNDLQIFEKKQYSTMIKSILIIGVIIKYSELFRGGISMQYAIFINAVAFIIYYWVSNDKVLYLRLFTIAYFTLIPLFHSYLPQFENIILALPANTIVWTLYALVFSGSFTCAIIVYLCNISLLFIRYKDLILRFLLLLASNRRINCNLYDDGCIQYHKETDDYEKFTQIVNVYASYCTQCGFAMLAVMIYFVNSRQQLIKLLTNERAQLKELNEKLVQANEQLLKNINSKDEFLLSVSHELRNPLNIIMGNIDLALMKIINEASRSYLQIAKSSTEMLVLLISNLLDSGKLQTQNLEVSNVPTKMNDFFERVWGTTRVFIQKKNLHGKIYIDKKIPDMVNIDPHRVMQIIFNLVGNAVKFTDKGYVSLIITWIDKLKIEEEDFHPSNLFYQSFVRLNESTEFESYHCRAYTEQQQPQIILGTKDPNFSSTFSFEEIPEPYTNTLRFKAPRVPSTRSIQTKSFLDLQDNYFVLDYAADCFPKVLKEKSKKIKENGDSNGNIHIKGNGNGLLGGGGIGDGIGSGSGGRGSRAGGGADGQSNSMALKGFLKIEVRDSGCGISYEEQEKLFKKFSQVGTNNSQKKLGSGLGLWISQTLCKSMGGEIRVSSIPEIGSTFIAILSCDICLISPNIAPKNVVTNSPHPISSTSTDSFNCLVVDDLKTNQDINISFLARCDIKVPQVAFNGLEAFEIFKSKGEGYFELIFMDVEMPIMNGIEAAKKIRRHEVLNGWRPIIITFITGNCKKEDFEDLLRPDGEIRADYVFSKPFTFFQCKDLISEIKRKKKKLIFLAQFKRKKLNSIIKDSNSLKNSQELNSPMRYSIKECILEDEPESSGVRAQGIIGLEDGQWKWLGKSSSFLGEGVLTAKTKRESSEWSEYWP